MYTAPPLLEIRLDGKMRMYTPHDDTFLVEFKEAVFVRSWKPAPDRYWECNAADAPYIEQLCQKHFGSCRVEYEAQPDPVVTAMSAPRAGLYAHMPEELGNAMQTLHLLLEAPLQAAEAVYKIYVRYAHPDAGGNPDDFRKYAGAIEIIRGYFNPKTQGRQS